MKASKSTIQKNIWVSIDEVCVTVIVTAKRTTIINGMYLSNAGKLYVKQQCEKLNTKHVVLSKQKKHVKRDPKNQTGDTLLSVKQSINSTIKSTIKNKKITTNVKSYLIKRHDNMKDSFVY